MVCLQKWLRLHGSDAGKDVEDLIPAVCRDLGLEEELMHFVRFCSALLGVFLFHGFF